MSGSAKARRGVSLVGRLAGAALRGRIRWVDLADVSDEFAFSHAPEGWQPNVGLLRERARHPDVPLEESEFHRFFTSERVRAVRHLDDVLHLHLPDASAGEPRFWLGTYPWGGLTEADNRRGGRPFGWGYDEALGTSTSALWGADRAFWYRPDHQATLRWEWDHTALLADRIGREGYRLSLARDLPTVCLMAHDDGRERFVTVDGHHRLAVLAARDERRVLVRLVGVVRREQVERWTYVRAGACPVSRALSLFDAFFRLDGSERLAAVLESGRVLR